MERKNVNELYKKLFKNEESRTNEILLLERFLMKTITDIEEEWKEKGIIPKGNYQGRIQKSFEIVQQLNKELRELCENNSSDEIFKNNVNKLLKMEEANFKNSIGVFISKVSCLEIIAKGEDDSDYKVITKEKEISLMKQTISNIRNDISDLITELKYQYL